MYMNNKTNENLTEITVSICQTYVEEKNWKKC